LNQRGGRDVIDLRVELRWAGNPLDRHA
jgi:hypothetical protein